MSNKIEIFFTEELVVVSSGSRDISYPREAFNQLSLTELTSIFGTVLTDMLLQANRDDISNNL
jgi:hypothetical protein